MDDKTKSILIDPTSRVTIIEQDFRKINKGFTVIIESKSDRVILRDLSINEAMRCGQESATKKAIIKFVDYSK